MHKRAANDYMSDKYNLLMCSFKMESLAKLMFEQEALQRYRTPPCLAWEAWNGPVRRERDIPIALSVHIPKIHDYPSTRYSVICLTKKGNIEKRIMYPSCIQGVKCNITKMFQIVPGITADISWKFHENHLHGGYIDLPIYYAMAQRQPIGWFYNS